MVVCVTWFLLQVGWTNDTPEEWEERLRVRTAVEGEVGKGEGAQGVGEAQTRLAFGGMRGWHMGAYGGMWGDVRLACGGM